MDEETVLQHKHLTTRQCARFAVFAEIDQRVSESEDVLFRDLADGLILPLAEKVQKFTWAQCCPAWAIFQSPESLSSRPRYGRTETNRQIRRRRHRMFASRIHLIMHLKQP
jgi:hypothetical protein